MKPLKSFVVLCLVFFVGILQAAEFPGQVIKVADGDTITVLSPEKKQFRIRFDGVDAPESGQPYGNNARQALSDKIFGKTVRVIVNDKDQYGRIVGTIMLGDRNINYEMLQEGHVWAYRQYLKDKQKRQLYIQAEEEARKNKIGLWGLQADQIKAPWEWRKSKKQGSTISKPAVNPSPAGFTCGTKQYCNQMTSCEEAKFYLNQCKVTTLDGNRDGIPCEALCRR